MVLVFGISIDIRFLTLLFMRYLYSALHVSAFFVLLSVSGYGQNCPSGFESSSQTSYASTVESHTDVDDEAKSLGSPNSEFAELDEKTSSELVLDFGSGIKSGDVITIYFASCDDGKSTTAKAYGFTDSQTKTLYDQNSTSKDKEEGSDQWTFTVDSAAPFLSIVYHSGEKLMIDAVSVKRSECFPSISLNNQLDGCKNLNIDFCLDSLLNQLGVSDEYLVSLSSDTGASVNGDYQVSGSGAPSSGEDCCDNESKPDQLTFTYVSTNIIDNSQGGGKSDVTTYTNPNGQTVYIVVNGESGKDNLSNALYTTTVKAGESFTFSNNSNNWSNWPSNMYFHILDSSQNNVLQLVRFHTSCSAPIVPGDQFGTLVLKATARDGVECGSFNSGDCMNQLFYSPDEDFVGVDTVDLEICLTKNGITSCSTVPITINVSNGNCKNGECPIGFIPEPNFIYGTSVFWSKHAKDKQKSLGEPDNSFAKIEYKGSGEIVLDFDEDIKDGNQINIYLASYKSDKSTVAEVYLWTDNNTWYSLGSKTISQHYENGSEKWTLTADRDAKYISVYYKSGEKVMLDAVGFEGSEKNCVAGNAITGTVWEDENRNQVIDGIEQVRAANVWVYLYQDADNDGILDSSETVAIDSQLTDLNGFYAFTREFDTSKVTDSYIVNIEPSGLPLTSSLTTDNKETASFTTAGNTDENNDFGYALSGSISGNVSIDINAGSVTADVPFEGVTITLVKDENGNGVVDSGEPVFTTQTDQFGNYLFENLEEGDYIVLEQQPTGYTSLRDGDESDDGDANDAVFNQDDEILVELAYSEADEDNNFIEEGREFGDLPSSFSIAVKGAYNTFLPELYMGSLIDFETSENSSSDASGDDNDKDDDEDGVSLPSVIKGGKTATYNVEVYNNTGEDAYLNVFVDVDNNGVFDSDESVQVVVSSSSSPQNVSVDFDVPVDAISGQVFTRVRLSLDSANTPSGVQVTGEIEDYQSKSEPLPVNLIAFQGVRVGDLAQLYWSTAQEENNEGFEVQRSYDNNNFETVGFVSGAGYSSVIEEYRFTDADVDWTEKVVYYRLKQVDYDGKWEYHGSIAILSEQTVGDVTVYPNPAKEGFKVDLSLNTRVTPEIQLMDLSGVAVNVDVIFVNSGLTAMLETSHVRAGVYILQVRYQNAVVTKRVLIHK